MPNGFGSPSGDTLATVQPESFQKKLEIDMSDKTLLANLPADKSLDSVLTAVFPVARENNAHGIGLHSIPSALLLYGAVAVKVPHTAVGS